MNPVRTFTRQLQRLANRGAFYIQENKGENAVFFLATCELVIDCIVQTDIVARLKEGKRNINPHAIHRVGAISQAPTVYSEFNKDTPSSYAMSSPGTSRTSRDVRLEASVLQEGKREH